MRTGTPSVFRQRRRARRAASRRYGLVLACAAVAAALAGCASTPPMPRAVPVASTGPAVTTIEVVQREWHTDICIRDDDAGASLAVLAQGFDGARFLCFGFGERQYVVERRHDLLTTLSALLPSESALLMTVLRASPAEAFGASNVVSIEIGAGGREGLRTYLLASLQTDASGNPVRLAPGPYAGSVFYAAAGTYDAFHTCNTWTARAMRSAGLPVDDSVLFAGAVMRQARRFAAAPTTSGIARGAP